MTYHAHLRILRDLELVPKGANCALLIRHADRDGALNTVVEKGAALNERGRKRSIELGKALKRFGNISYHSSPIARCVETCERIAEGYGEPGKVECDEFLGMRAPTMLRPEDAYSLMRSMGLFSFVEAYVNDRIDPKVAVPCSEGARMFLSYAMEKIKDAYDRAAVIVTHDMLITPALVKYYGYDVRKNGLVPFLDGIILYSSDYGYRAVHEGKIIKVTKEGAPKP